MATAAADNLEVFKTLIVSSPLPKVNSAQLQRTNNNTPPKKKKKKNGQDGTRVSTHTALLVCQMMFSDYRKVKLIQCRSFLSRLPRSEEESESLNNVTSSLSSSIAASRKKKGVGRGWHWGEVAVGG